MIENRFWILLARKTTGEILADEEQELQQLLSHHPEYHLILEALEGMEPVDRLTVSGARKEVFLREGWKRLSRSMEGIPENTGGTVPQDTGEAFGLPGNRSFFWRKLAAAVLLVVAAGGIAWLWRPLGGIHTAPSQVVAGSRNQVSTKNGSRSKIDMPDGSTVWLNGGSRLIYDNDFSTGHREVCLKGEAYFEIKKDPGHPFVIQTRQVAIKVLGTVFNVRAYRNEGKTTTTLIQGKVEVEIKDHPGKPIILHPNERLTVIDGLSKRTAPLKKLTYKITDIVPDTVAGIPPEDIAWVSNKLVFKNESFKEVAYKMERWYDMVFIFKDRSLEREILTGAFGKEKLGDALNALRLTTPFKYSVRDDTVYLMR